MTSSCTLRARIALPRRSALCVALLAAFQAHFDGSTTLLLPAVTYPSGGIYANSVVVADLNRDQKPDIVTTNLFSSSVGVLLNHGDGTFEPAIAYVPGGLFLQGVAVADVNSDDNLDVLVAIRCLNNGNCAGVAGVMLGNGDGTLQAASLYPSGGDAAWSIAAADVNRDGSPDLLIVNEFSNSVGVLLGNGDGSFQLAVTYNSGGGSPRSVTAADVNGDGVADLAVANRCGLGPGCLGSGGGVGVLIGNGDGTFQSAVSYDAGGDGPVSVAVADVNGDGTADLVVANVCSSATSCVVGSVSVLAGIGDGTFGERVTYQSTGLGTNGVGVADIDADGQPDLAAANLCLPNSCREGGVDVRLAQGHGIFGPALSYSSGAFGAASIVMADVNGDDAVDVVVANQGCDADNCESGTVGVLLNNVMHIQIDIQPGRFPNRLNARSHARVHVALMATADFDPTTVDTSSIRFGRAGASTLEMQLKDVDRDGRTDAIVSFKMDETGIACADSSAKLIGMTLDGQRFHGVDSIEVLGCETF